MGVGGDGSTPVKAVGEGIFQLDQTQYSIPEGEALLVRINRTQGATLTEDVTLQVAVHGGTTNVEYPASTENIEVKFEKGSNLSSKAFFVQTLNQERFIDVTIQITIRSVSNGGMIGAISTAPITLLGFGTPRVYEVNPDSGSDFATDGTIITVVGINFMTNLSSATVVRFNPILGGNGPIADVTLGEVFDITPTSLKVKVPVGLSDFLAVGLASSTYHVQVEITAPLAIPPNSLSAQVPADQYVHTTGPTVTNLNVRIGPPTGGTLVTVTGTKFGGGVANQTCASAGLTVRFGVEPVDPSDCTFLGTNRIRVKSPEHLSAKVNVIVGTVDGDSPPVPDNAYSYAGAPVITGLDPSFGPPSGGNTVVIYGANFEVGAIGPDEVLFGGNEANFIVISDSQIVATVPAGSGVQQVKIVHPISGISEFRTEANYSYSAGPLINEISPTSGPVVGGTEVTIRGTGFLPGSVVKFGEVQAFATVLNSTQITATAPPGVGIVSISVNSNGELSPPGPQTMYSYDGPTVTSVTPIAGPIAGGTPVTVMGTNFTTASIIQLGTMMVVPTFVSPTILTFVTPPSTLAQAVHVRVTTGSGQSPQVDEDLFTYTNGPIVDQVNPDNGPTLGGTIVVITGKNFTAPLTVYFGTIEATSFNVNSATQITVLSPPNGEAGPVDIRVTKGNDTSPPGPDTKFEYTIAAPKVTQLSPNQGSTFGGTPITLTGLGFTGAACPGSVKFGTVLAATCTVINDTTISTVAPPNASGATVVTVSTQNGTSEIVQNYTYVSPNAPGGGTTPPAPTPGGTTTYTLTSRWTLLTWTGLDQTLVSNAVRGVGVVGASDLSARISAFYLWNAETASYTAYFTGAEAIPGANDFATLTVGAVYWVAITETGTVPWVVLIP